MFGSGSKHPIQNADWAIFGKAEFSKQPQFGFKKLFKLNQNGKMGALVVLTFGAIDSALGSSPGGFQPLHLLKL